MAFVAVHAHRGRTLGGAAVRERGGPAAGEVVALGLVLLWPAAAYQIFDGLYCGAGFCLRGAGDTRVPAATALVLSWFFFVPLAHTLIFAPGQGWIDGLPQFGLGARGGWLALMSYVILLGCAHVLALAARRLARVSTLVTRHHGHLPDRRRRAATC